MHFNIINLLQGIGIGIVVSIPLGPVGLIIMKRTAEFGFKAGVFSGLAIAIIDTIGTVVILLGLHRYVPYFHHIPRLIHVGGAIIIFIYGLRISFSNPIKTIDDALPWHQHFLSSVVLALTNPSTYFSFGIISLMLSRFVDRPLFDRIEVVIGFFIGAILWWTTLAYIAFTNRDKLVVRNIQMTVGIIIMILAVLSLLPHTYLPEMSSIMTHKMI